MTAIVVSWSSKVEYCERSEAISQLNARRE